MSAAHRATRSSEADARCVRSYAAAGGPETGVALVAVGGYGRRELAPFSDLDVVLIHDDEVDPGDLPAALWYPLWDAGHRVDHAVRSRSEMLAAAADDPRVLIGLVDLRHLAGDARVTERVRGGVLAAWRRGVRERLPQLRDLVERRHRLVGELAHAAVPDLKEAAGGLRDASILRALVATWLVDVPQGELEEPRQALLDVRDLLHERAGRACDRIAPEDWPDLAAPLGLDGAEDVQQVVRRAGRRVAHLSRLTWQRVDALVAAAPTPLRRGRAVRTIAPGLGLCRNEVVLDADARPQDDPLLLLRAAAEAAERGVALAPATAALLVREGVPLPHPWPTDARHLLIRLLAAGRPLLGVWETLEETGAVARFLPEWERVLLLPHASTIHRFTVDRHVVETVIEAAALIGEVARPDLLLVAALLHDIGKGGLTDHSVAGAPLAHDIAARMGFAAEDRDLIATLVRWHLLLVDVATTRDPDDPATVALIVERLRTPEAVRLLVALSEADARATTPKAWSPWRATLVRRLAARVLAALDDDAPAPPALEADVPVPEAVRVDPTQIHVAVEPTAGGAQVVVISGDRLGLLADVAATLALQRLPVRAARAWTEGSVAISAWDVAADHVDAAVVRQRLVAISRDSTEAHRRLSRPAAARRPPSVVVRPEASASATVIEVRMEDRPGVVHVVCACLAALRMSVRSAHLSTLGPQAVDVFYVQEEGAAALADERAAAAAHAIRDALSALVDSGPEVEG